MQKLPEPTAAFIARCNAYATRRGVRRTTLSAWLFNDGKRLDQLAAGSSDIGVQRLDRAVAKLGELERETV